MFYKLLLHPISNISIKFDLSLSITDCCWKNFDTVAFFSKNFIDPICNCVSLKATKHQKRLHGVSWRVHPFFDFSKSWPKIWKKRCMRQTDRYFQSKQPSDRLTDWTNKKWSVFYPVVAVIHRKNSYFGKMIPL